jgi:hypothetical protein
VSSPTSAAPASTGRRWPVRLRQGANAVNLSTLLGLALARWGRARLERGPHGLVLAHGYARAFPAPRAPAFTVGDVVLLRLDDERLARRPRLLDHEARHAAQYAFWLGPAGFLPAYLVAAAWSWFHTGDFSLRNVFEVRAGLVDGGYVSAPDPGHSGQGE